MLNNNALLITNKTAMTSELNRIENKQFQNSKSPIPLLIPTEEADNTSYLRKYNPPNKLNDFTQNNLLKDNSKLSDYPRKRYELSNESPDLLK